MYDARTRCPITVLSIALMMLLISAALSVLTITEANNALCLNRMQVDVRDAAQTAIETVQTVQQTMHDARADVLIQASCIRGAEDADTENVSAVKKAAQLFDSDIQAKVASVRAVSKPGKPVPTGHAASSVGRVIIPGLVNMSLVNSSLNGAQAVIDSGVCAGFTWNNTYIIGGHRNRGFNGIKSAVPGKTYAYINGATYICAAKSQGHNTGTALTDSNYTPVSWGGPVMYTCNDNWQNVTIVYWRRA